MTPQDEREMLWMRRELADVQRKLRGIPSRWSGAAATFLNLRCGEGNTLLSTPMVIKGLKVSFAALTAVPTAAPLVATTYADGLGYGQLYNADGSVAGTPLLWVYNGPITVGAVTTPGGIVSPLAQDVAFWVARTFQLPVTAAPGTFATVYQVYRV